MCSSDLQGGKNSAATLAGLTPAASSTSHNDLHFVSLRGSRELANLPGGALAVPRGDEVVPLINRLARRFTMSC